LNAVVLAPAVKVAAAPATVADGGVGTATTSGAPPVTVQLKLVLATLTPSLAVTTTAYVPEVVGVPLTRPVAASNVNPGGSPVAP
jgi:hypothetical protein